MRATEGMNLLFNVDIRRPCADVFLYVWRRRGVSNTHGVLAFFPS